MSWDRNLEESKSNKREERRKQKAQKRKQMRDDDYNKGWGEKKERRLKIELDTEEDFDSF